MNRLKITTLTGLLIALWLAASVDALAGNYKTCIKWKIKTVDSGISLSFGPKTGTREDWYRGCNSGCKAIARGVRVKVSRGSWSRTFDSNPKTGCFEWSHSASSGFDMRVYGFATDANDNYVRIHNNPNSFTTYPGNTYSVLKTDVSPTHNGTNTYVVGSQDRKWTAMAALAFGLYRYHTGLNDKAFHVGIDTTRCGGSSAHYGQSNSSITEGRHYIKLGGCSSGGTPQAKRKFVVAHELGHAIAALFYGNSSNAVNGGEPGYDPSHNVAPNACGMGGTDYGMRSKEWNMVGFREGFAHFIAAKIWNNKHDEGVFHWFGDDSHDLERWGYGAGTGTGGRLENECCTSNCGDSWDDAGTNEDWLRFFWDFYTNNSATCPEQPTKYNMLQLYALTRLHDDILNKRNYFDWMRHSVGGLSDLPSCVKTSRFDTYAGWNGIDN